jgi:hypothetical protein
VLLASFAVGLICTFGVWLRVDGHKVITMPWEHIGYLPLFNNVLPTRLMLFVLLAVVIGVVLWISSSRSWLRIALPVLAVITLIPNPEADAFRTTAYVPQFFRGDDVQRCVAPDETVLIFPQAKHGNSMLWQAVSGYRFRLADGYVTPDPPVRYYTSPAIARIANRVVTWRDLEPFARAEHVTTFIVDGREADEFTPILQPLAPPRQVGGVLVYHFDRKARC